MNCNFGILVVKSALTISALFMVVPVDAQSISIGVPKGGETSSMLTSTTPTASLLRSALFLTALRMQKGSPDFSLWGAMSFNSTADGARFTLLPGLRFSDGSPIRGEDVTYSLQRCLGSESNAVSELPNGSIQISTVKADQLIRKISFQPLATPTFSDTDPLAILTRCPIIPAISRRFGPMLGKNFSIITSGPYAIEARSTASNTVLTKNEFYRGVSGGPETISIQEFADDTKALSALRSGALDAAFLKDVATVERANNDPTLVVSPCSPFMLIFRRGLQASCQPFTELDRWHYSESQ